MEDELKSACKNSGVNKFSHEKYYFAISWGKDCWGVFLFAYIEESNKV